MDGGSEESPGDWIGHFWSKNRSQASAIKCHKTPQNDKTAQGTLIFLGWVIFAHLWSFDSFFLSLSDCFCPTLVFYLRCHWYRWHWRRWIQLWRRWSARRVSQKWPGELVERQLAQGFGWASPLRLWNLEDFMIWIQLYLRKYDWAMVWGVSRKFSESIWSHRGWLQKWWYHVDLSKKNGELNGIQWDFTCFTINLLGCNPLDRSH